MNQPKASQYLTFFVFLSLFSLTHSKFDITLETNDKKPKKLVLFADFNFSHLLLQSVNFDCDKNDSCEWKNKNIQVDKYGKYEYKYREALITINFKKMIPDHPKAIANMEVKVLFRITDSFNVLGINDKTSITRYLQPNNEFVVDLKKKTVHTQEISKTDSNIL